MSENGLNISRRGFVAGAGAAALGAGLAGCSSGTAEKEGTDLASTSPEKTAYDPEAGEWIPTTCNMCFNNCSIKAHVVDGVVVELTGNPESSIGNGHICGKGAAGIMMLYDPNRITKPMKRTNPKKGFNEDPGWEEISWDEAYDLVDSHMREAIERSGPHAVIGMSMVASQIGSLVRGSALGAIYGSAEGASSDICGTGVHQMEYLLTGTGNARPDYKYCNYVIQFGTNAGTATRHGFNMTAELFANRRAEGLRHVVFDPHMGASGEKADLWVPIRPGTDAAAALAIANVLIEEGLIDVEFLKTRTNAPSLVNVETGRILFDETAGKSLYMDADGTPKTYDKCADPVQGARGEVHARVPGGDHHGAGGHHSPDCQGAWRGCAYRRDHRDRRCDAAISPCSGGCFFGHYTPQACIPYLLGRVHAEQPHWLYELRRRFLRL